MPEKAYWAFLFEVTISVFVLPILQRCRCTWLQKKSHLLSIVFDIASAVQEAKILHLVWH